MYRILFVDDDAAMRELVRRVLERQGYFVHAVPTAEVALVLLEEKISFDLLITDVVMPGGMNGFDLADRALAMQPRLNVIYLTGFVNLPRRRLAELRGRLVAKPVLPSQLVHEVRGALAAAA
ncbi:MAG TPA: response regulator [Stellaceae bacterium]|jgi:CheY-like chemotaxis protein|nr:response regulator [Stellaceae bacterium]